MIEKYIHAFIKSLPGSDGVPRFQGDEGLYRLARPAGAARAEWTARAGWAEGRQGPAWTLSQ